MQLCFFIFFLHFQLFGYIINKEKTVEGRGRGDADVFHEP